ncbi:MAG: hypothetical protein LBU12_05170 [Deltaproteobacteria bacterium]|jgi:hypothetical protein|nr:hypothetical protein [Deltaproteobacteria bacterium]
MHRFIDNKLVFLPNILDINKKGTFKDFDAENKLVILAKKIKIIAIFIQFFSKNIGRPGKRVSLATQ